MSFKLIAETPNFIYNKIKLFNTSYLLRAWIEDNKEKSILYVMSDKVTGQITANDMMILYDEKEKAIKVQTFYPNLHTKPNSKGLSAACFYILLHHFAEYFNYPAGTKIWAVMTEGDKAFEKFYSKLRDFKFIEIDGDIYGEFPGLKLQQLIEIHRF
ncbi:MAG: hypothetical protein PHV30_08995 [Candidatus Margulisbacteria bacterium]|nr:hypothetical protein [Candidatus Margulisiibacteriota bacterium]